MAPALMHPAAPSAPPRPAARTHAPSECASPSCQKGQRRACQRRNPWWAMYRFLGGVEKRGSKRQGRHGGAQGRTRRRCGRQTREGAGEAKRANGRGRRSGGGSSPASAEANRHVAKPAENVQPDKKRKGGGVEKNVQRWHSRRVAKGSAASVEKMREFPGGWLCTWTECLVAYHRGGRCDT